MKEFVKGNKYSSRELMERAYELSLASIGEHDDKPDPLVGAIIATVDGQILAEALPKVIDSEVSDLSAQDKEGIQFIQANKPIAVNDYAERFGITAKTAQRRLSDLADKGLIIKEGERRWTKYRLKK